MIKVFFDASVMFSALYSPTGASYALANLVKEGVILGITSETVIEEVSRNIGKITINISALYQFINEYNFIVLAYIIYQDIRFPFLELVDLKDRHVIAGAMMSYCDYLVTLDKKHLDNQIVQEYVTQIKIVSPQRLLKEII